MKKLLFLLALTSVLYGCGSSSSSSSNSAVDLLTEVDTVIATSTNDTSEAVVIDNVVVSAPDNTEPKAI